MLSRLKAAATHAALAADTVALALVIVASAVSHKDVAGDVGPGGGRQRQARRQLGLRRGRQRGPAPGGAAFEVAAQLADVREWKDRLIVALHLGELDDTLSERKQVQLENGMRA
ncbi:hypothetical protein GCM10027345_35930 [Hymenobacter daeguensis]